MMKVFVLAASLAATLDAVSVQRSEIISILPGNVSSLGGAPPTGCTKEACLFSYTNPAGVNQGRCGEVDAAPRMPADIWSDSNAVQEYVGATNAFYKLDGIQLKQKPCDRKGRLQRGSETVSWTTSALMKATCSTGCNCDYPSCPDSPDVPRNHQYCSLCGPKFNKDIEVKFWVPFGPGPAPSPPPAGCTAKSCPFSYTNPLTVNFGRCGEVDASERMPRSIFDYPGAVDKYVQYTLQLYKLGDVGGPEGGTLVQAPCDHTKRVQRGNASVSWTTPELMGSVCKTYCACNWPSCPVSPDDPSSQNFCSLCGAGSGYNAPYDVKFWYYKL